MAGVNNHRQVTSRQRNQILFLAFHFPRLVLGRYLPFFRTFLLKRPPYLLEFVGKSKGDELVAMMQKAEERFAKLPSDDGVQKNTYVIAPRIRWQGMLTNDLCSFWSEELSEIWSGAEIETSKAVKRTIAQGQYLIPDQEPFIYTVKELQEMCRQRSLPASGDKYTLVARLFGEGW